MVKHLALAILVFATPAAAFGAQGMSIEDGFAVASNAAVEAPMQDAATSSTLREPGAGRGSDEADNRSAADSTSAHGTRSGRQVGSDAAANAHAHKGHAKTPWQSLLPGVMK